MAELVHSVTVSNRDHIRDGRGLQHADMKLSVWSSQDKVALVTSYLITNDTGTGKRWWRWVSAESMGFYRRGPALVPYCCSRKTTIETQWSFRSTPEVFDILEKGAENDSHQRLLEELGKKMKIYSSSDVYPMMRELGIARVSNIPIELRRAMRADSPDSFKRAIFGVNRNIDPESLVKNDILGVAAASIFKRQLGDTGLVGLIENSEWPEELSASNRAEGLLNDFGSLFRKNERWSRPAHCSDRLALIKKDELTKRFAQGVDMECLRALRHDLAYGSINISDEWRDCFAH